MVADEENIVHLLAAGVMPIASVEPPSKYFGSFLDILVLKLFIQKFFLNLLKFDLKRMTLTRAVMMYEGPC